MIQVQEQISLRRQCELLAVGRSGLYYEPVGTSAEELALMRRIDEIHLEWPFYGSRKLCEALRNEGTVVNRKHMQRLMRLMGLESLAPKPDTSKPSPRAPRVPVFAEKSSHFPSRIRCGRPTSRTSRWRTASRT